MKIKFIGPISRVTGSCYHLVDDARGAEYLVDFGMVQNEGRQIAGADDPLPFDVERLRHVFLTHAHIDHCGMIPLLYKRGYRRHVWCTKETAAIAAINLRDAARLGSMPYGVEWVDQIQWKEPRIDPLFNKLFAIDTDLFGCFYRTAHIAGAVSIGLTWGAVGEGELRGAGQRTIVFSGDLGVNADGAETQALMKYRMDARDIDYAVCESTYGGTERKVLPWSDRIESLAAALDRAIDRGGVAIIPVFSIGRCQDILLDVAVVRAQRPERYAGVSICLDSPMGVAVSEVYAEAVTRTEVTRKGGVKSVWLNSRLGEWLGMDRSAEGEILLRELVASVLLGKAPPPAIQEKFPGSLASRVDGQWIRRGGRDAGIGAGEPQIVIASSGMCTGGPVVRYLQEHLGSETTTVIFPGYVASGTPGHRLLGLMSVPAEQRSRLEGGLMLGEVELPECSIRAEVVKIDGYSGHADQVGLADWLVPRKTGRPAARTVFLSHGNDQARRALQTYVRARHGDALEIVIPETANGWYDLDLGRWTDDDETSEILRLRNRVRLLEAEIARLTSRRSANGLTRQNPPTSGPSP